MSRRTLQTIVTSELLALRYHPDILSREAEEGFARELEQLPFKSYGFQGILANRQVVSVGYRYDYDCLAVVGAAPFPTFVEALRRKIARIFDHLAEAILINQ